jgi:hypothetical protein
MERKIIVTSKFFWPWDDDKEEHWLQEMSQKGLHLLKPGFFGRYTFAQSEPRNYIYRLDFFTSPKKDNSYTQLFSDAGWHQIGEMGGWQYFRKEVTPGESAEIFTDTETKVQKYQRLLVYLMVFMPIWAGAYVSTTHPDPSPVQIGLTLLLLVCVLFYVYLAVGILWRITQLQKKV